MKMNETLVFVVEDAVVKHEGCEQMDPCAPGKVTLHIYPSNSSELKDFVNHYMDTFQDIDIHTFVDKKTLDLFKVAGISFLKLGSDQENENFVAILSGNKKGDYPEYQIIRFDGSLDQFGVRWAQIVNFFDPIAAFEEGIKSN